MSLVPKPSSCLVTAPLTCGILVSRNPGHLRAPILRLRLATAFGRLPVLAHPLRGRKRSRQLCEAFIGWMLSLHLTLSLRLAVRPLALGDPQPHPKPRFLIVINGLDTMCILLIPAHAQS